MTSPTRPRYTSEVEAAMRAQGILPPEPEPDGPPEGQVRYHLAIEGITTQTGAADPATLAATLRGLAARLNPEGA